MHHLLSAPTSSVVETTNNIKKLPRHQIKLDNLETCHSVDTEVISRDWIVIVLAAAAAAVVM